MINSKPSTPSPSEEHTAILRLMERYGYMGDKAGMCLGIAYAARNALLLGAEEIKKYNTRIEIIKKLYSGELVPLIKTNKERQLDALIEGLWREHKALEGNNDSQAAMYYEQHQQMLGIKSFLDNIEIFQNVHLHPEIGLAPGLSHQSEQFAFLTESNKAAMQGGMVLVNQATCLNAHVYKNADEGNLLKKELGSLAKLSNGHGFSICLVLHSRSHVVALSYMPKKNIWNLVNAGAAREVEFNNLDKIISQAFSGSDAVVPNAAIFSMRIFTLNNIATEDAGFNEFNKQLLLLTKEQSDYRLGALAQQPDLIETPDEFGDTVLSLAVYDGNTEQVAKLLELKADVNSETPDEPYLSVAASKNHSNIAGLLLRSGAKVDKLYQGVTALYRAAQNGNVEVCKVLLEHNADPNIKCKIPGNILPVTPITAALLFNHTSTFKILFENNTEFKALTPPVKLPDQAFFNSEIKKELIDKIRVGEGHSCPGFFGKHYYTAPILWAAFNGSIETVRALYPSLEMITNAAFKEEIKEKINDIFKQLQLSNNFHLTRDDSDGLQFLRFCRI